MSAARGNARLVFQGKYPMTPAARRTMMATRPGMLAVAECAAIRFRLRGARPDVAHLGADAVSGGSGGTREAPSPVHRPSPAVALPSGGPGPVRRVHRRPRAGGDSSLQRAFHGGAVRATN